MSASVTMALTALIDFNLRISNHNAKVFFFFRSTSVFFLTPKNENVADFVLGIDCMLRLVLYRLFFMARFEARR